MPGTHDLDWFAARTDTAPESLRLRAENYLRRTRAANDTVRLEVAGAEALHAAIEAGQHRAAALDLLAADALITLALLAQSEADPARLGDVARGMRLRAIA